MRTFNFERCFIERVIDGDTYVVLADLGFHVHRQVTVRLAHVDTPEPRGASKAEGLKAKQAVIDLIGGQTLRMQSYGQGKYGRWICEVFLDNDMPLSDHLFEKGLAKRSEFFRTPS